MTSVRNQQPSSDKSLDPFVEALESAGYPVFSTDNLFKQILLSACASEDGKWILADASEFSAKCGGPRNSNDVVSQ
ncbi:unnamed protein product [Pseudo-nitzschia multistriata]|uniref:Uncharacterized protein n=1 Tax=Pseudo-nitzschia multistriata TaxID=183589 RepID=A0A448Z3M9_9STRA|nr:unnamed protein product [Pseudo-nitzschia multistriata]